MIFLVLQLRLILRLEYLCIVWFISSKKRHWNVGRIIAEEMKPLQFEEIEDIAALIPEAELIIDYPSQDLIFLEKIQNLKIVENPIQKT